MDVNNLKHVVGQVETGKPAIIRFFSSVDSYSAKEFNDEFLWLQNCVKPSKIVVMINSEGGSVLYGMSMFSVIQSCPIEVDCIIEGIAASMGSVIWAAGANLYMHDYSLLMIHNPFRNRSGENDANTQQTVNAFRSQLETIYRKRFGMTKEQVQSIMDGEEGVDGTFFTAQDAVKAGFIQADHILKTSKLVRDKVKNQIDGVEDATSLRNIMSSINAEVDENKLLEEMVAIRNREDNSSTKELNKRMKIEEQTLELISARLGFDKDAQTDTVMSRIDDLIKREKELKETQSKYTALEIKHKGVEAELSNVKNELNQAQAELKTYKDAEAAAHEAEITALIDKAVESGKIEASAKESWIQLAHKDFETVKASLGAIRGREDIPAAIANDPVNAQAAQAGMTVAEKEVADKVKAVCGENFQLKKFA